MRNWDETGTFRDVQGRLSNKHKKRAKYIVNSSQ